MTAVVDTSALITLARARLLSLLSDLFGAVLIPPAVQREALDRQPTASEVANILVALEEGTLAVKPVPASPLRMGLGAGESEVIELAISLENVIVVIDEKKGRAAAVAAGLRVTGTVGVLLEARERGHIHSVGLLLQNMRDSGFRISNSIFAEATAGDP